MQEVLEARGFKIIVMPSNPERTNTDCILRILGGASYCIKYLALRPLALYCMDTYVQRLYVVEIVFGRLRSQ